ncbi:MAG: hypothetical protein ACYS8W_14115 [Planctomycetota bacterium]|jgi:hypothetical protein
MHDPKERVIKGSRRKRIAWAIWGLALILIASGMLIPYKVFREAVPLDTVDGALYEIRIKSEWNPLVSTTHVREHYLQTRKIGYDSEGRRIDDKVYLCLI